jgi:hypothetical protein
VVSALSVGRRTGSLNELVGLVHVAGRDLTELVTVLAGVVGAEEKLAAGLELDTEVGLGTATVAAVRSAQRRSGGNGSGHFSLISLLSVSTST